MVEKELWLGIGEQINKLFGFKVIVTNTISLERACKQSFKEMNYKFTTSEFYNWISKKDLSENEKKIIAKHLTIGETYFFRERIALDFFINNIVENIRKRFINNRHLNIWTAGCSSGEEPYTIAILLKEFLKDFDEWKINILATDLNTKSLEKAKSGIYTNWSFRDTDIEIKNKYFKAIDKNFQIDDEIKNLVDFKELNLITDNYTHGKNFKDCFDVIFCRNVLMYFSQDKAGEVTRKFHNALKQDGFLITSQVELIDDFYPEFGRYNFKNGIFYSKNKLKNSHLISFQEINPKSNSISPHNEYQVFKSKSQLKNNKISAVQNNHGDTILNDKKRDLLGDIIQKFDNSHYEDCIELCKNQKSNGDFNLLTALYHIKSLANLGNLEQAYHQAHIYLAENKSNIELMKLLATINMELHKIEEAESILIKILYLEPFHKISIFHLGNIQNNLGKIVLAKKQYSNLISLLNESYDEEIVEDMEGLTSGSLRQMTEMLMERL